MANLNVSMTLSMLDTASPQVKAFIAQLEALGATVSAISTKIASFSAGLKGVGDSASVSGSGVHALEQAMGTLSGSVSRAVEKIAAATVGLTELGIATNAAGVAAVSGAAKIEGIGAASVGATRQVAGLSSAIKGMAELWAAFEIEKGLKKSVNEASEFQKQEMTVVGLNLGDAANQGIFGKSKADAKALQFVSALDAIKARMAAIGGLAETMDQKVLDATIPAVMKLTNNLTFAGDKTDSTSMVRNIFGIVEARQQTHDVKAMLDSFDVVQKAYTATLGKVTPRDIEMFLRQLGQGAANLSDDGLMRVVAIIDQMKIAGGGDGQGGGASKVGTAAKMLTAYALGKPMNKQGAAMLMEAGIFNSDALREDGSTTLASNIKPSGGKDAELAAADIVGWAAKYAPNIIAYTRKHAKDFYQGKDINDPTAIDTAVQKFLTGLGFTVTAAQMLNLAINPRSQARIEQQRDMQINAKGVNAQNEAISQAYAQQVTKFDKALADLSRTIGERLLPLLTPVIEKLAEFVRWLTSLGEAAPVVTTITLITAAIGGIVLAVNGIKNVFGVFGTLGGLLRGVGGAAAAGTGVAGASVAGFGALALAWFTRIIGGLFKVVLAFDIGYLIGGYVTGWLNSFSVGGTELIVWAVGWGDRFVTVIENAWIRTKSFFGLLGGAAADAEIKANNASLAARVDGLRTTSSIRVAPGDKRGASGRWGDGNRGASGTWDEETHPTNADNIRAKQLEDSKNVVLGPHIDKTKPKSRARAGGSDPFRNYNAGADEAANEYRREQDDLRNSLKVLDALYKAGKVSIDDYYTHKQAAIEIAVAAELRALEKEKAALLAAKHVDHRAVNATDTKIYEAKNRLDVQSEENALDRDRKRLELEKIIASVEEDAYSSTSRQHDARLARLTREYEIKIKILELNGKNDVAEAEKGNLGRARVALKYDDGQQNILKIQDEFKLKEEAITLAEKNGQILFVDAENQKYELRQQELIQIQKLFDAQLALAQASGDERKVFAARQHILQTKEGLQELTPIMRDLKGVSDNAFGGFFENILSGSKSAKSIFKDLFNSIKHGIDDIVSKMFSDMVTKYLVKQVGGEGGLEGILSMFGPSAGAAVGAGARKGGGAASAGAAGPGAPGKGGGTDAATALVGLAASTQVSTFALKEFSDKGLASATGNLFENVVATTAETTISQTATGALTALTLAAQSAAAALASMATNSAISGAVGGIAGAAGGGDVSSFATGIDRVPRDMLAYIHKDETILNSGLAAEYRAGNMQGKNERPINVVQNFTVSAGTSRDTQTQFAYQAGIGIARAARRNG